MTDKQKLKWQSRRWILVLWAISYLSVMSIFCVVLKYDGAWVPGVMAIVGGIPVSYVTISSLKKPKEGAL